MSKNNGTALTTTAATLPEQVQEMIVASGDLGKLSPTQRTQYLMALCESLGLNALSRPIELITLNGKTVPYAKKDCTDQLRKINRISIEIVGRDNVEGIFTVTARATTPEGRQDEDVGSVVVASLKGDSLANAIMKCHTKAKRRVTLSICGLGLTDESELETIPRGSIQQDAQLPAPNMRKPVIAVDNTEQQLQEMQAKIDFYTAKFAAAKNREELQEVTGPLSKEPKIICDHLRKLYAGRLAELP